MYEEFYGLRERPFELTPDPRFLFMTAGHGEALSAIQYGISGRRGVTLLVGAAGTGKTTVVHAALERQNSNRDAKALVLTNPTITRSEFFTFLALELGLSRMATRSKVHCLRELHTLLAERQAAGAATALIIDEAQSMPDELLEEVRLLANMETATEKLLPVVLVGQLELAARLNSPTLRALKQRVALRATLGSLTDAETSAYIAQRIRVAGGDVRAVFTRDAMSAVFASSGGLPRTVSVICDNALVSGFAMDARPIDADLIGEVCGDFDLPAPARRHETAPAPIAAVAPVAAEMGPASHGLMVAPPSRVLTMAAPTMVDLRGSLGPFPEVEPVRNTAVAAGKSRLRSVLTRINPRRSSAK